VNIQLRLAALAIFTFPFTALAVLPVNVIQKGKIFSVETITLTPGQVVRFENQDSFPHQINVSGPGKAFDSDLQDAGQLIDVPFPSIGRFDVRCGIHPRMRMTVSVEAGRERN